MKAYELQPKEGFSALTPVDREASPLGPRDVRVRVHAVSLNYRDVVIAKNAHKRARPTIPVSDGAGEVIEVGPEVSRVAVGDRVAAGFFPTWIDGDFLEPYHANALGGSLDGVLAEERVLREDALVKLPASLSYEAAATLPCAGVTAWNALHRAAQVKAGDTVLVQGTGGVSIFGLQLARAAGARVIATSSSASKRARLESMGAFATIDYRATPQWGDAARAVTGGRGVDVAIEVGGAGTFDQSVKALRFGGTMSLLGILAGTQGPIDTHAIFHKNLKVHGVYVGSIAMFEELLRAIEVAGIAPVIDRVFPFDEARAAYEHLASGEHFGKVVVRVGR
jgi:NADPH:quinone reductase-like Zn-dependent oxidoreductase